MKRGLLALALGIPLLVASSPVLAQEEEGLPDARYEGYAGGVKAKLEEKGTAGTWAIFVVLAGIGLGVMFKSGNRTHLD